MICFFILGVRIPRTCNTFRALNDVVREAQASGAAFDAIDALSKAWSEKACLMRFPQVCLRVPTVENADLFPATAPGVMPLLCFPGRFWC